MITTVALLVSLAAAPKPKEGKLDSAEVAKVFSKYMPQTRNCLRAVKRRLPNFRGTFFLVLTIGDEGKATTATLESKSPSDSDAMFEACLLDAARSWQFPIPEGGPVPVRFPLYL